MLAQLCLLIGALAADATLANGIRVVELPPPAGSFEIVAGYQTGAGPLDAVVSTYLFSTEAVRAMAIAAYGAGGQVQFISDLDRMAVRISGPSWIRPVIDEDLVKFFEEIAAEGPLLERAIADVKQRPAGDFRAAVEEQLQAAVLGSRPLPGELSQSEVEKFFAANYGTDRAFVLVSGAADSGLELVQARKSVKSEDAPRVEPTARSLRFKPDLPVGAVILASPAPSVYYEAWYATLLLDRLIQLIIPGRPSTTLIPRLENYYYRLEIPVPEGQFDDVVEARLIEELGRLQSARVSASDLEVARASAIQYLEEESIQLWFRTLGIERRRLEGIEWLKGFSADDVRIAARDFLAARAVASWSPKPKQITIEVENLSDAKNPGKPAAAAASALPELPPVPFQAFPAHSEKPAENNPPELLSSGVSIVASSRFAIFVAPQDLKLLDREPDGDVVKSYGVYRSGRILVMAPADSLARMKELWNLFAGNPRDTVQVSARGAVANIDLPALVVLKMMLDRRLIEAGLWNAIQVKITVAEGSRLAIEGSDENRRRVLGWIRTIALETPSADLIAWARESAIHHLDAMRPDLQSLLWQRDGQAVLSNLRTITANHVKDIAGIYFQ